MCEEKKKSVRSFVAGQIAYLSSGRPAAAGEKAVWRHAFAGGICDHVDGWGLLMRDIPEELSGINGTPSRAEKAAYMALSAYAACGRHTNGISIGQAASALGGTSRTRFMRLEKAKTLDDLWRYLKPVLRPISSGKTNGLDYALLARDLNEWQYDRLAVVRKWEREYCR